MDKELKASFGGHQIEARNVIWSKGNISHCWLKLNKEVKWDEKKPFLSKIDRGYYKKNSCRNFMFSNKAFITRVKPQFTTENLKLWFLTKTNLKAHYRDVTEYWVTNQVHQDKKRKITERKICRDLKSILVLKRK